MKTKFYFYQKDTFFLPETTFTDGECQVLTDDDAIFQKSARVTLQDDGTSIKWEYAFDTDCDGFLPEIIPLDTCYEDTLNWLKFEKVASSSPALSVGVAALTAVVARLLF